MDGVRISLLQLIVLHQHDCDSEIEEEETTDDDAAHEIERHEYIVCNVLEDIHYCGPALHRDALEDCDEGVAKVVEVGYAIVQL